MSASYEIAVTHPWETRRSGPVGPIFHAPRRYKGVCQGSLSHRITSSHAFIRMMFGRRPLSTRTPSRCWAPSHLAHILKNLLPTALLSIVLASSSESFASGVRTSSYTREEARLYARELRSGLVASHMLPADANRILRSLIEEGLTKPLPRPCDPVEAMKSSASIADVSNSVLHVKRLVALLERKYDIHIVKIQTDIVIIQSIPRIDPVISSFSKLKDYSLNREYGIYDNTIKVEGWKRSIKPWNTPIRILSSGVDFYDSQIRQVLADLKRNVPGIPIDDMSFPAPIDRANVFIDLVDLQCPIGQPCRRIDTWKTLAQMSQNKKYHSGEQEARLPLIFFGERVNGHSSGMGPIFELSAFSGLSTASAYLRTDIEGHIVTAACSRLVGKRFPPYASDEASYRAIRSCLAAALGAPARDPPVFGSGAASNSKSMCPDLDRDHDPVDQTAVLRSMY